ncbi:benzoate MFS transporter BenK [Fructilactobacillus florum 8D]|uniref:Benzoate MFS transporter BenK n=2 Tax=Fructilactobacillus florum TaxID=640331 RepID=W9EHD6_9LACO|nr:MFS transporter [Fructilactobacillus florum]ETO40681.1 benzoate MFS transporter BenK [Fructilactobacillus florum 8D]
MKNHSSQHFPMTKRQKLVLFSASSGFGLENMDVLFLSFTLSSLIAEFHLTTGAAGLIGTITNWGMLLGGILFGWLGDRFGRVRIFSVTILFFAIPTVLMSVTTNLTQIYFLRLLAGIGAGGEYGLGITLVAETFPQKMLGRLSSLTALGGQVGAALAAICAALIIPAWGWRALYLMALLPLLLIFLVRNKLTESPSFINEKPASRNNLWHRLRQDLFGTRTLRRNTFGLMTMVTVQIAGYFGLMNWLPTIVQQQSHLQVAGSSLWMIATIIGMSIGMLTFGTLLDHYGPRRTFGIFLIAAAGLVYTITLAHSIVVLIILGAVIGFFANGMYGGYGAIVSQLYPTAVRASANNIIMGTGRAVGGLSSVVIGILMEHFNLLVVMLFLSTLYLISFIVMITLPGFKTYNH